MIGKTGSVRNLIREPAAVSSRTTIYVAIELRAVSDHHESATVDPDSQDFADERIWRHNRFAGTGCQVPILLTYVSV
jgi:hypothetical protein